MVCGLKLGAIVANTLCAEMGTAKITCSRVMFYTRLRAMEETHKANLEMYEKHEQSRQDSNKAISRLEGCSGDNAEQYQFLQEMRGYVQDLLECFREKVPLIIELETAMHQLFKQRAARLVQRRQDDIKDESSEFSSHSSQSILKVKLSWHQISILLGEIEHLTKNMQSRGG